MNPSIPELFAAPQMAAPHILDSAPDMTTNALTATHAETLWQDKSGLQMTFGQKTAARSIIDLAEDIQEAIACSGPDISPPWESSWLSLKLSAGPRASC